MDHANYFEAVWSRRMVYSAGVMAEASRRSVETARSNGLHKELNRGGSVAPTFINNTNATIWFKPENNSLSPVSLAPGKSTTLRVDGVTHPSYPGQVFKVRSGFDFAFGIEANQNGVIVGGNSALWPLPAELNYLLGGGWLTAPPDAGWNDIFNRAGYKKP